MTSVVRPPAESLLDCKLAFELKLNTSAMFLASKLMGVRNVWFLNFMFVGFVVANGIAKHSISHPCICMKYLIVSLATIRLLLLPVVGFELAPLK